MSYRTLRSCVEDLEKTGQLIRIEQTIDPHLEAAAIQRRVFAAGGPALYFASVKGCRFPMVSNLFGTMDRLHFLFRDTIPTVQKIIKLGVDPLDVFRNLRRYLNISTPLAALNARPKYVRSGDVMKETTTLQELPQLVSWGKDAGPYITLPCVYTEDPDNPSLLNSNLGMYRVQISGGTYKENQVGMHYQLHRGMGIHHLKAIRRKEKLCVNVFIGGAPSMPVAALAPLPEGMSELTLAGLLTGRRIPMIRQAEGPAIYADADFCLQGFIEPQTMMNEGPFGDKLGYYSSMRPFPVMRVVNVFHRPRPIWPFTVVGNPPQENTILNKFIHELVGPIVSGAILGIKAIQAVDDAGGNPLLLAIGRESYMPYIGKRRPMELLALANAVLGTGQLAQAKYLFIAAQEDDPQLTVDNVPEFMRHVLERVDFTRDLHFFTRTTIDSLDYASDDDLNNGSKLVIAVAGAPIRKLPMGMVPGLSIHESLGFSNPRVFLPGILLVEGTGYKAEAGAFRDNLVEKFCESFKTDDPINQYPLIVVVDNVAKAGASLRSFLWTVFTKSDPAADIYGIGSAYLAKHWGCRGSLVIDARTKPFQAEELEEDPEIVKRVKELAAPGKPLHKII